MRRALTILGALASTMLLMALAGGSAAADGEPRCFGERATRDGNDNRLLGTNGPDVLVGTPGRDVIIGRDGNDSIYGLGDNDRLCGGDGEDDVFGDQVGGGFVGDPGEAGNDSIDLGRDADGGSGDGGNDLMRGQPGDDTFSGDAGADRLFGGYGDDTLDLEPQAGNAGSDTLVGGRGDDELNGAGNTQEFTPTGGDGSGGGSEFDDRLFGEDGEDVLRADDGIRDLVDGGARVDECQTDGQDEVRRCNSGPPV